MKLKNTYFLGNLNSKKYLKRLKRKFLSFISKIAIQSHYKNSKESFLLSFYNFKQIKGNLEYFTRKILNKMVWKKNTNYKPYKQLHIW